MPLHSSGEGQMSNAGAKRPLSSLFPNLAALTQAVRTARNAALEEARETVGGMGFFRSSGAEFCAVDAGGDKVSEGGVHPWDGTRRSFERDIKRLLEIHPQTREISLEGVYSWAERLSDFENGDRKLRRCSICEGIGHKDRMLTLPGWPVEQLFHGDCAVRMLSRSEVLAPPWSEQKKLTIEDTGVEMMRDLLASEDAPEVS